MGKLSGRQLSHFITPENRLEWCDEIVACDRRHSPLRRGTIAGISGVSRLWVEWFDSGRRTWINVGMIYNWEGCTDPIPKRGYVVRAPEAAIPR